MWLMRATAASCTPTRPGTTSAWTTPASVATSFHSSTQEAGTSAAPVPEAPAPEAPHARSNPITHAAPRKSPSCEASQPDSAVPAIGCEPT